MGEWVLAAIFGLAILTSVAAPAILKQLSAPAPALVPAQQLSALHWLRDLLLNYDPTKAAITAAVILAQVLMLIFRRGRVLRTDRRTKESLADQIKGTGGNVLSSLAAFTNCGAMPDAEVQRLVEHVLQMIVSEMKLIYKKFNVGDFEASMLVFAGGEAGKPEVIRIFARANPHRQVGGDFPVGEAIAYYVAKTKEVFIEENIKDSNHPFAMKGLSAAKPPYASILFIPVHHMNGGNVKSVRAVLTIDCADPYFFTEKMANVIVTKMQIYRSLMTTLLESRTDLNYVRVD